MSNYNQHEPLVNKMLNEDGSLTTFSGELVNPETASDKYLRQTPFVNKILQPDGSFATLADVLPGGGSGTVGLPGPQGPKGDPGEPPIPEGGVLGDVLIKNSPTHGDASWKGPGLDSKIPGPLNADGLIPREQMIVSKSFTPFFTDSLGANTYVYSVQQGVYTKIGGLVFVDIALSATSKVGTVTTGQFQIGGLPYPRFSLGGTSLYSVPSMFVHRGFNLTSEQHLGLGLPVNSSSIAFYVQGPTTYSVATVAVLVSPVTALLCNCSLVYMTNS